MFLAKLENGSILRDSVSAISSLITEATFTIDTNGIKMVAMDPASVAMIIFNLLSTAFSEFKVDGEVKLTLNVDQFNSILSRLGSSDEITLSLDEEKTKLKILMKGASVRKFEMPLLEDPEKTNRVPELDFKTRIDIEPASLKEGIKDAGVVSDCVTFFAKDGKFSMIAVGDSSRATLELSKDSPAIFDMKNEGEQKAKYSLEYLDKVIKAAKLASKLTLQYKTDFPARLDFIEQDKLQMSFILAPRVETE